MLCKQEFRKALTLYQVLKYSLCVGLVVLASVAIWHYWRGSSLDRPEEHASPSPSNTANLDALRSLPYTGSTEVEDKKASGVVFHDPKRSSPGYSLYAVHLLSMAELIDETGKVVKSWKHSTSGHWANAELLPNGDLLVVGADHEMPPPGQELGPYPDDARYVLRFNWQGELLWNRKLWSHHDIEPTADGNLLLMTFQRRLFPELHAKFEIIDDQLTLLKPDGTVIESYSLLDAISRKRGVFLLQTAVPLLADGVPAIDVFHSNSIEWMHRRNLVGRHPIYDLGNILVCFRHQDRIAVFNWKRNEVVWSWGRGIVSGPHDAHVLKNGHILLFDNGLGRKYSRLIELDPLTEKVVWEYKADPPTDFFTLSRGSVQRLPNGNTLAAESDRARAFEVTPEGEIVWEFLCPHEVGAGKRATISRIKRYPVEFIEAIIKNHE